MLEEHAIGLWLEAVSKDLLADSLFSTT